MACSWFFSCAGVGIVRGINGLPNIQYPLPTHAESSLNTMKYTAALGLVLLGFADAYPNILQHLEQTSNKQEGQASLKKRVSFDVASQLVDVSGQYAFVPPGSSDQRGPCPGLNALANHNYIPHNGVGTIDQFVEACNKGEHHL